MLLVINYHFTNDARTHKCQNQKIILFIVSKIGVGKYAEILFQNVKDKLSFKVLLYYNWLYSSSNIFSVNVTTCKYKTAPTC